ncbi:MAG: hypothetical protein B6241_03235 [Spirochaetaceae bacterium 4572_59]|nr:MAG: hypothetical protein B6241_03235 [Spirochaetaceae bacterium 4572_59]
MTIYESAGLSIELKTENILYEELIIRGEAYCVWPNREGEGFTLDAIKNALDKNHCQRSGLSLSWPATASSRSLLLKPLAASPFLIQKKNTNEGFHEEIRIFADTEERIRIRFCGKPGQFEISELPDHDPKISEPKTSDMKGLAKQFQLGLIGPRGECHIPPDQGFKALLPLGKEILKSYPLEKNHHILHLFGYAAGHDRGYPDYSPSEKLGGWDCFKETLNALKTMGFRISLYMNARLLDKSRTLDYSHLKNGILKDSEGNEQTEEYFGRIFYVMNPGFSLWCDELYKESLKLQELGADWVQLDQVAGRAALVPPGDPWGQGYNSLIQRIQSGGMKVWIQGVSDYYGADCYEMTWRNLNILEGGILRGGNPFGKNDLSLLKALSEKGEFSGSLLIPLSKYRETDMEGFDFRLDMMGEKGALPLYGPGYLDYLHHLQRGPSHDS